MGGRQRVPQTDDTSKEELRLAGQLATIDDAVTLDVVSGILEHYPPT